MIPVGLVEDLWLKVHIWGHISYTHDHIGRTFATYVCNFASYLTKIIWQEDLSPNAHFYHCSFYIFLCEQYLAKKAA